MKSYELNWQTQGACILATVWLVCVSSTGRADTISPSRVSEGLSEWRSVVGCEELSPRAVERLLAATVPRGGEVCVSEDSVRDRAKWLLWSADCLGSHVFAEVPYKGGGVAVLWSLDGFVGGPGGAVLDYPHQDWLDAARLASQYSALLAENGVKIITPPGGLRLAPWDLDGRPPGSQMSQREWIQYATASGAAAGAERVVLLIIKPGSGRPPEVLDLEVHP